MNPEPRPTWVVSEERGVAAEARTRAFLLDRFWVLERSVDIQGADFIIERRLWGRSLLDRRPPAYGFIQAKFYGDVTRTSYIHREYVLDPEGQPRREFFLLCHTGNEDSSRCFLLSATDIATNFNETPSDHSEPNRFALPGTKVLVQRFEVIDRASTLDRIERALRDADFHRNRAFLSWAIPRTLASRPPLSSLYEEPIDNWWAEIPEAFEALRKRAQRARLDVEAVLKQLQMIEGTADPEEALGLAEDFSNDWEGSVRLPDLFDEDFLSAVRYHKRRYEDLHESGLLGAHAAMRRTVLEYIVSDLAPRMPFPQDHVYILKATYDPETFLETRYETQIERIAALWPNPSSAPMWFWSDIPRHIGLLVGEPGNVQGYIAAGRLGYPGDRDEISVDVDASWPERLRGVAKEMTAILLEAVLAARFGE